MSEKQITVDTCSDLELCQLLQQTYQNLMREQTNLQIISTELHKRKEIPK
jgi:hypothetical protein